jgi:hypothetical protein
MGQLVSVSKKALGFSLASFTVFSMNLLMQRLSIVILALFILSAPSFAQDSAPANASANAAVTDADGNPVVQTHPLYVGIMGGAAFNKTAVSDRTTQFNYGAHIGIDAGNVGKFSKLAFGFHFDNLNLRNGNTMDDRVSYGTTLAQVNFRRVSGTGFYFGPEAGFTIVSLGNVSSDAYTIGAFAGYDWNFCHHLSLAPEVHYDRNGPVDLTTFGIPQSNMLKLLLALNYHFE